MELTEIRNTLRNPGDRVATLPGNRTIRVRAASLEDRDELTALFEDLSDEDRHLRFFTSFRPGPAFVDRLVDVEERGGCALVAVVEGPGHEHHLAGEADYEPTRDGVELSITVGRPWRGWLGPYLFDALLEVAACRGIPRLQADVLRSNRAMLSLLHSRGFEVVDDPDPGVVRISVPTGSSAGNVPSPHS